MSNEAHSHVQIENEHFRVTKWTIHPDGHIPMHRHEHEYVVVPLTSETMHVVTDEGEEIVAELTTGQAYTRPAGSTHQVENRNADRVVEFIEVERLS